MNLHTQGLTAFETEVLFRKILNMDQIKFVSNLIFELGKYMVLDRFLIDNRAGKVGLSYIQKASEFNLITEYKYLDDSNRAKDYYFYSLAPGGIYFLESEGFSFHKLPKYTNQEHRERILTFNHWALKEGYTINMTIPQSRKFDFFITNEKIGTATIIGYFENLIKEHEVTAKMLEIVDYLKENKILIVNDFIYKKINVENIKIGNKAFSI